MMNISMISVVMSVYNSEKYLAEAIESILNQTYTNFEFIIINDGSTDRSLEIIQGYMNNDERIILISRENKGLTFSLNEGIKKAIGTFIARMDADDISMINRLENFVNYVKKYGDIAIYSTPAYKMNQNGVIEKAIPNYFRRNGFNQKLLKYYNSMIHGTLIVKSTILKKLKYNEEFKYSQDFELYHRLMKKGYKITYDKDNITYKLRVHNNSISNIQKPEQIRFFKKIFYDNNLKFYEQNFMNRIYFKIVDILFYFKKNHLK